MSVDLAKYGDVKPLRSYALGLFDMLKHAIYEHRKNDRKWRDPRMFKIHPECMSDLLMDDRILGMMAFNQTGMRDVTFCGVPVIEDAKAPGVKMITADGMVVYL